MTAVQKAQQVCLLLESVAREMRREVPGALTSGKEARDALLERVHAWQAAIARAQDQFQRDMASIQGARTFPLGRGTEDARQMSYRMNQSLDDQAAAIEAVVQRVRKVSEEVRDLAKSLNPNRGDIQRLLADLLSENIDVSQAQQAARKQITEALAEGSIQPREATQLTADVGKAVRQPLTGSQSGRTADPLALAVLGLVILRMAISRRKS